MEKIYFIFNKEDSSFFFTNSEYDNPVLDCIEVDNQTKVKVSSGFLKYNTETKTFDDVSEQKNEENLKESSNRINRKYLAETDWMVMRHIREKALGVETSLTDEEYIQLEQKRAEAALNIV